MEIRLATAADAPAISCLIQRLTEKYIAHELADEGRGNLLASMAPEAIERYLAANYRYHVAIEKGDVVGVVATRDNQHLFHLFVAEALQRRGIATQLWAIAKEACAIAREACVGAAASDVFTVNSSRYAVGFYRKLGFVEVGAAVVHDGVVCIPMQAVPPRIAARAERVSPHRFPIERSRPESDPQCRPRAACPVCGGELIEMRAKLQCSRCHTICETCCEGGRINTRPRLVRPACDID